MRFFVDGKQIDIDRKGGSDLFAGSWKTQRSPAGTTRAARDRNGCRRAHDRRDTAREGLPVDRIAVVTGASRGIGEAIARALAAQGWHCVLLARREDRLRALADELGAEYELCDVGKREDVERVAAAVLERHPQIQLLVNNAGIPGRAGFATIDLERLEEVRARELPRRSLVLCARSSPGSRRPDAPTS